MTSGAMDAASGVRIMVWWVVWVGWILLLLTGSARKGGQRRGGLRVDGYCGEVKVFLVPSGSSMIAFLPTISTSL